MSQVRLELANRDEEYDTPEVRAWLRECEAILQREVDRLEVELLIHGAVYATQENITATEINLRRMTL